MPTVNNRGRLFWVSAFGCEPGGVMRLGKYQLACGFRCLCDCEQRMKRAISWPPTLARPRGSAVAPVRFPPSGQAHRAG